MPHPIHRHMCARQQWESCRAGLDSDGWTLSSCEKRWSRLRVATAESTLQRISPTFSSSRLQEMPWRQLLRHRANWEQASDCVEARDPDGDRKCDRSPPTCREARTPRVLRQKSDPYSEVSGIERSVPHFEKTFARVYGSPPPPPRPAPAPRASAPPARPNFSQMQVR